jgi:hypothetical protein
MRHRLRGVPLRAVVVAIAVAALGLLGVAGARGALASSPPSGSLSPGNLQSYYGLPSATQGSGQTVAVIVQSDDPDAASDLAAYRSNFGLPACTAASGCFTKVNEDGSTSDLPPEGTTTSTSMALDAVSAVCPNCDILLVEAGTANGFADIGTAVDEAVTLGADFIDVGYAQPEAQLQSNELTYDGEYFDHRGVVITAPAGDKGYGVSYPAASQYVVAVGGTELTADSSSPRGFDEAMWPSSGGGCSEYEPQPSWQANVVPSGDCGNRVDNDVSAVATNFAYYDTPDNGGNWNAGNGTEISSAIVAAAYALAGAPATSVFPAQYLYQNAQGLYDITSGSQGVDTNGTCSVTILCTVGAGYDAPTGLGSPDGVSALLASYYQPITPTRFLDTRNGTGGVTGPVASDSAVKLSIEGANGVPFNNVTAVAVTITVVSEQVRGLIRAYPDGAGVPGTSNVNFLASQDVSDMAIVPVGADGDIDLYNASTGTVQLLADVSGYFTSDPGASGDTSYTPVTPVRILDTRNGTGAPEKPLAGGSTLALLVAGANGIPSGISAVVINVTAVNETGGGWLAEWADGTTRPSPWSDVQFGTTSAVSGLAIVPVGTDGKIDIASNLGTSDHVDVVGDVVGYFSAGTTGEAYRAISLTRILDTRSTSPIASSGTLSVSPGRTVVAPTPTMIVTETAVAADGGNFITYPSNVARTGTSSVNFATGATTANLDLASTGGGAFDIYNESDGANNVVLDCQGYLSAG